MASSGKIEVPSLLGKILTHAHLKLVKNTHTKMNQKPSNLNQFRKIYFILLFAMASHTAIEVNIVTAAHGNTDKSCSQNMSDSPQRTRTE